MAGLVLSRKPSEKFVIYDRNDGAFKPIVVTLESGSRSSIKIEAASHLSIVRYEKWEGRIVA